MNKQEFLAFLIENNACTEARKYVEEHPSDNVKDIYLQCPDPTWWIWLFENLPPSYLRDEVELIQDEINQLDKSSREAGWYKAHNMLLDQVNNEFGLLYDVLQAERKKELEAGMHLTASDYRQIEIKHNKIIRFHVLARDSKQYGLKAMYEGFYNPLLKELAQQIVEKGLLPDWGTDVLPEIIKE